MLRYSTCLALLAAFLGAPVAALAQSQSSPARAAKSTVAGNTQFILFNLPAAGSYSVRRNQATVGSATAGPAGTLSYTGPSAAGDTYQFVPTGINPVTPSVPSSFVATGNTSGCVALRWDLPDAGEYVTEYSLLWGAASGGFTDSVLVDRLQLVRAGSSYTHTRCGFADGTYRFAIRAHSSFDLWSGLSGPSTTTITNQNTQGPPPPTSVAVTETPLGCAKVTWTQSGDPTVVGYRIYYGTRPRSQAAYTDSLDVAQAGTGSACALSPQAYYLAVCSRTSLGILSGYSKEVSLSIQGPDLTPPLISQMTPADGTTGVPRNTTVFFEVVDGRSGVNPGSISATLNGQACPLTVAPVTGGYAVQCKPTADLPADTDILVQVTASDQATPANAASVSWTFQTGATSVNDIDPPTIQATSPGPNATGVSPDSPIDVSISDTGLGVDLTSVVMRVDGAQVVYRVEGNPASARIIYEPAAPFRTGSTVAVRVEACDRAGTPNCAVPLSFSFSTGYTVADSGPGAIVPDGFWADDPDRPLEVRNLPLDWHVRIFDAAGIPVRRFENRASVGYTWTWDFMNDGGQRVAPALYLVRVTDGGGTVQGTARFLVQSP